MKNVRFSATTCVLLMLAAVMLWLLTGLTLAGAAVPSESTDASAASVLRARHESLRGALASNAFQRPLVLDSSLNARDVNGEIHAVVPYPFATVSTALAGPQGWCDILILHLNTKYCRVARDGSTTSLLMNVGKKFDQPLEDSFRLTFDWQLADQKVDYLRVRMNANDGPLTTRDYRITLEAVPLRDGTTFLHLSYSYGFGLTGKLAMQGYLGTVGRNKVGFTREAGANGGGPVLVDGMRGLVERNTMRYYLAIDAFLGALTLPEGARFEKRINDWFTAAERYAPQLHEMERAEYLVMKRREYRRQQSGDPSGDSSGN